MFYLKQLGLLTVFTVAFILSVAWSNRWWILALVALGMTLSLTN